MQGFLSRTARLFRGVEFYSYVLKNFIYRHHANHLQASIAHHLIREKTEDLTAFLFNLN